MKKEGAVLLIKLLVLSLISYSFMIGSASAQELQPAGLLTGSGSSSKVAETITSSLESADGVIASFDLKDDGGLITDVKINRIFQKGDKFYAQGSEKIATFDGVKTDTIPIKEDAFNSLKGIDGAGWTKTELYKTDIPLIGKVVGGWAHLAEGFAWSIAVVGAIQLIGGLVGVDQSLTNTLSISATAGIMSYKTILAFTQDNFLGGPLKDSLLANYAPGVGLGVAVVTFVLLYKDESKEIIEFQCQTWEAPLGGANCEECNKGDLPCSEYRCKSLGQACEIVNPGTEEEQCVWVNPKDVNMPTITPWEGALTEDHVYTNHDTLPKSLGTRIRYEESSNGCLKAFTPIEFGIVNNEPAQCKIGVNQEESFEEMQFFMGQNSYFLYNHTEKMRLPSPDSIAEIAGEEFVIGSDGNYNFYVKCQDKNGNVNENGYVFQFCVDPTPDTTPPVIETTSISNGNPVSFGAENVDLSVYVNEPAECKWSIDDKAYADMENTMSCSKQVYEMNAQQLYECKTALTGIQDREQNNFYFRCKDQPNKEDNLRNVNSESYVFTLLGSQELNIIDVAPDNETIFDSTETVEVNLQVETSNGVDEGKSICYFSPSGVEGSYIAMFETDNYVHSQTLSLTEGSYEYFLRCVDLGGNSDSSSVRFDVFTDNDAPLVTRTYKEGVDALKIVTNEDAQCSYSLDSCNFAIEDGIVMRVLDASNQDIHYAEWKTGQTYYVKCQDDYGNQPGPNACSVVVGASSFG